MFVTATIAFLLFAQNQVPPQRIVAASNVRLRSAPQASADEVARLPLGAVVAELEPSADGLWFRVETADRRIGWISRNLLLPFSMEDSATAYRRVVQSRFATEQLTFADARELFDFVSRIPGDRGELAVFRLRALARSVAAIMEEEPRDPLQRKWVKSHENEIVFSEPAGQFFVRSELYWDLEREYRGSFIAEQSAWEAANAGVPGECEGYIPCTFEVLLMTDGRYLELYPAGPHADEALEAIAYPLQEIIRPNTPYTMDTGDGPQLRAAIARLSTIVDRAAGARRAEILANLKRLEEIYQ